MHPAFAEGLIQFKYVDGNLSDELPDFYCKYAPIDIVRLRGNLLVNQLLDAAPIVGDQLFTTVDVKVQHLDMNETTCLEGWHRDTISDPYALHHLYVIGKNRTEFKIWDEIFPLPEKQFCTYGSDIEHRGPEVTVPETRFLLRVTESSIVKGNATFRNGYPYRFSHG